MKKLRNLFLALAAFASASAYGDAIAISTTNAPAPDLNTSQGLILPADHQLVFTSQILPKDPYTNENLACDVVGQFAKCLDNVQAILEAGGSSMDNLLHVHIFLADLDDAALISSYWQARLTDLPFTTRSITQSNALPQNSLVTVDVVAYIIPPP